MMKNCPNPRDPQQAGIGSSSPGSYFEREDWTDFRTLDTLCRRAGVPREELPKLVVKELVDNALDGAGTCSFGALTGGGFYVDDKGAGLLGTDQDIASLFSISRPITSSKLIRMPTRGALGNGLRVVAGSVLATGGELVVMTGGRLLKLAPQDAGGTSFVTAGKWRGKGLRVEVRLGRALETTRTDIFDWARRAQALAMGQQFRGGSSPWWYDSDSFWALFQAARNQTVVDVVRTLEGCTGTKAGVVADGFQRRLAREVSRDEASQLLQRAQEYSRKVKPERLGSVGRNGASGYAKNTGAFVRAQSRKDGARRPARQSRPGGQSE